MTFAQLTALAAVCVPVLAVLSLPFSVIDVAYLIRAGDLMLDTSSLTRFDTFTFTAGGQEWLNQQWGTELMVAFAHRIGGWPALILMRGALVGAIFSFEYLACRAAGAGRRAAGWMTLAAFIVCYFGLTLRSNLVGLALFALTMLIIETRRTRPTGLWLLPVVVLVWTNTHGSFPMAFLLLLVAWLEDRRKEPATAQTIVLVGLASLASTLANPFGARVWEYVAELTTNPRIREFIIEWQPTWRISVVAVPFVISVIMVAAVVVRRRTEIPWPRILGLAVFAALGMQAVRGVWWWSLAAPVLISPVLPERTSTKDPRTFFNATIGSALLLLVITVPLLGSRDHATDSRALGGRLLHAPERFTEAVGSAAAPGSRLFVAQIWASWFELVLPRHPVFIDPRIELFTADVWDDYDAVSEADEGWQETLEEWDVDVLVLTYEQQAPLIEVIATDPSWAPIYRSPDGIALIRANPAP